MSYIESGYVKLYRSGELEHRAKLLESRISHCDICPNNCGVDRSSSNAGYCHCGQLPIVANYCAHLGEEPAISGTMGSGTIFFANCNMNCLYCQNFQISRSWDGRTYGECSPAELAEKMLYLQNQLGCHNINLVSPTHFVPQILRALIHAIPSGLHIPLVYNSSGFDSADVLEYLDSIVDIYLPDLRYSSNIYAKRYSLVDGYVDKARGAIKEMYRQVGNLIRDDDGLAVKGLIIRLLILPNGIAGTVDSVKWIAGNLSTQVTLSIMSQYNPLFKANAISELNRCISIKEYDEVVELLGSLQMENGWVQEIGAENHYLPDFDRDGHPFDGSK